MYTKKKIVKLDKVNIEKDSRKKFCFISILINDNWTIQYIIHSRSRGRRCKDFFCHLEVDHLNAVKLINIHQHC